MIRSLNVFRSLRRKRQSYAMSTVICVSVSCRVHNSNSNCCRRKWVIFFFFLGGGEEELTKITERPHPCTGANARQGGLILYAPMQAYAVWIKYRNQIWCNKPTGEVILQANGPIDGSGRDAHPTTDPVSRLVTSRCRQLVTLSFAKTKKF